MALAALVHGRNVGQRHQVGHPDLQKEKPLSGASERCVPALARRPAPVALLRRHRARPASAEG